MSVLDTLRERLPLSKRDVQLLMVTAPARYKVHSIQKRNGRGTRTIAQPTAEIKILQRIAVAEYIVNLPIHSAAKAYQSGSSIMNHAAPHAKHRYLLKLDFENFFPSIMAKDFLKHLEKYSDVGVDDAKLLARLLFWRPKGQRDLLLSIGAPSSPAVSNTVMFDFDTAIYKYCKKNEITYTRYADDLALSTNRPNVLNSAYDYVLKLCASLRYPKLVLNDDKTVFVSKKHHRQLTGLVLSNDGTPSLGRDRKRLLRAMAHRYSRGLLEEEERFRLRGWIAFTLSIDKQFVQSLVTMIGEDQYKTLMTADNTSLQADD